MIDEKNTKNLVKQSQIEDKMQLVGESLERLESNIHKLSNMIQSVVRPSPPPPPQECEDTMSTPCNDSNLVPLAEAIERFYFRSDAMNKDIYDLLDRIEL